MQKFIILARFNGDGVIYMLDHINVDAKNWEDAYNKVVILGYTPLKDELITAKQ